MSDLASCLAGQTQPYAVGPDVAQSEGQLRREAGRLRAGSRGFEFRVFVVVEEARR